MNVPEREQQHNLPESDEPAEIAGLGSISTLEMAQAEKTAAKKKTKTIGFQ